MVENNFSPGSVIRKKGIEIPFDNISIKKRRESVPVVHFT